ncbi:MAG TPA: ComF family protein [Vicinamibacterales bacterium]|nr:ComF family protein [Vicinamibacterales bacterium]
MIILRRLADSLLSTLLGSPCAVCARVLDRPLSGAVCDDCWSRIVPPAPPFHGTRFISTAAAIGEYDGVLREIIHALKYQGRRSTAPRLSALMAMHGRDVLATADAVVPVPLHRTRERARGFNQAEELARGLGLPVQLALRRVRITQPQVDLPAGDRHSNVKDAFAAAGCGSTFAGKILVLVDDVTTTGATLEACARVLSEAGAQEVRALTAARVSCVPR